MIVTIVKINNVFEFVPTRNGIIIYIKLSRRKIFCLFTILVLYLKNTVFFEFFRLLFLLHFGFIFYKISSLDIYFTVYYFLYFLLGTILFRYKNSIENKQISEIETVWAKLNLFIKLAEPVIYSLWKLNAIIMINWDEIIIT